MRVFIKTYFCVCAFVLTIMLMPNALEAAMDQNFLAEVQRLKALKKEDPEAFHEIISKKKNGLKNNFQHLKEEDPERFQDFLAQRKQFKRQRLKQLRQENPQAFNDFMDRKRQRMEHFREKNPEKFKKMMDRHPKFRQQFQQRQKREGRDNLYEGTYPRGKQRMSQDAKPRSGGRIHQPGSGKFHRADGPRRNRVEDGQKSRNPRGPRPAGRDVQR